MHARSKLQYFLVLATDKLKCLCDEKPQEMFLPQSQWVFCPSCITLGLEVTSAQICHMCKGHNRELCTFAHEILHASSGL